MLNKFKAAEKSLKKTIKSKTGRKGLKMYKEVKDNVVKPSLAKKTIGGFSRGIQKERQLIADKKYQQVVQEWRASMLRLALEMVDAIEFAMKKFGHTADDAKAYSDRALAKVLVIKERLAFGKYDSMIDDVQFAIDTFTSEIIAASGMGLLEQKFFNSCINGADVEEDFDEDLDDEFEEDFDDEIEDDFLDSDEEPQENFEGTVEDYREVVDNTTPDEDEVLEKARIHWEEVRGERLDAIAKFLEEHEHDEGFDYDRLKFLRHQVRQSESDMWDDVYFKELLDGCIVASEQNEDEESTETSDIPETAAEAVEAAVKEVLEMDADDESNGRYPAKKKGKKPANAETK